MVVGGALSVGEPVHGQLGDAVVVHHGRRHHQHVEYLVTLELRTRGVKQSGSQFRMRGQDKGTCSCEYPNKRLIDFLSIRWTVRVFVSLDKFSFSYVKGHSMQIMAAFQS